MSDTQRIEIILELDVPARYDPDEMREHALRTIEHALDEKGGEAFGLLVALGWRQPDDY